MKVKLIFLGLGIKNNYQANILIYDSFGNLIYSGQTYNGMLNICLNKNGLYRLKAYINNDEIDKYLYINNNKYIFCFNRSLLYLNNSITLLLTDYYYNLPIEKGELILWQK